MAIIFRNKTKEVVLIETVESNFVISCIISVYNESEIIDQKLQSLLSSDYLFAKIFIYIGSDASTDGSAAIIKKIATNYPQIYCFEYSQRRGKSQVVNDLVNEAFKRNNPSANHILLFTDANVILGRNVLQTMSQHFENMKIGLVDSRIIPTGIRTTGISSAEQKYMTLEIRLKHWESELGGFMMGAFGGCFMIRSVYFKPIPPTLLVDDFFLSMNVLRAGGKCINDLNAVCYEGVPNSIQEEFRRKSRISAGNFQNLAIFYPVLFSSNFLLAYAFLSHKVLRWFGPVFLLIIGITSVWLTYLQYPYFNYFLAAFSIVFVGIPFVDFILERVGIWISFTRNVRYFVSMNIALLFGLIKYVYGIENSTWQPPKRNI